MVATRTGTRAPAKPSLIDAFRGSFKKWSTTGKRPDYYKRGCRLGTINSQLAKVKVALGKMRKMGVKATRIQEMLSLANIEKYITSLQTGNNIKARAAQSKTGKSSGRSYSDEYIMSMCKVLAKFVVFLTLVVERGDERKADKLRKKILQLGLDTCGTPYMEEDEDVLCWSSVSSQDFLLKYVDHLMPLALAVDKSADEALVAALERKGIRVRTEGGEVGELKLRKLALDKLQPSDLHKAEAVAVQNGAIMATQVGHHGPLRPSLVMSLKVPSPVLKRVGNMVQRVSKVVEGKVEELVKIHAPIHKTTAFTKVQPTGRAVVNPISFVCGVRESQWLRLQMKLAQPRLAEDNDETHLFLTAKGNKIEKLAPWFHAMCKKYPELALPAAPPVKIRHAYVEMERLLPEGVRPEPYNAARVMGNSGDGNISSASNAVRPCPGVWCRRYLQQPGAYEAGCQNAVDTGERMYAYLRAQVEQAQRATCMAASAGQHSASPQQAGVSGHKRGALQPAGQHRCKRACRT